MSNQALDIYHDTLERVAVLRPCGELSSLSYLHLRDAIIKAGMEQPRAVVVDTDELRVVAQSALVVFTSARWQLTPWPDVPVLLAASTAAMRNSLQRNGITRYCPCYDSVLAAVTACEQPPEVRCRVARIVPKQPRAVDLARRFVAASLHGWGLTKFEAVAFVVVTELLRNALDMGAGDPEVRVEYKAPNLTIAVADDDDLLPTRHEHTSGTDTLIGLGMVASVSRCWGSARRAGGGKVVWAVLGAGDII